MLTTDPFIEVLVLNNSNIEREIYETLLRLANNEYLLNFFNTPTWALSQLYKEANNEWVKSDVLKHPKCDRKLVSEAIKSTSSTLLHGVVHNPTLTIDNLKELKSSNNESVSSWANYYLLKDSKEAEEFIISELRKLPAERNFILSHLIRNSKLTQSVISILIKNHIEDEVKATGEKSVGDLLKNNPHLNTEHRAELKLIGLTSQELSPEIEQFLPSSFLFFSHLNNKYVEANILEALLALGHPCGLPNPIGAIAQVLISELNLYQLIKSEFLHRMFWRDLQSVGVVELNFRNGYQVSDLFIKHKILSKEFDEGDFEEGWKYGGVLPGYVEREWIILDPYLDPDLAPRILDSLDSLVERAEYSESFSELYPSALAYFMDEECGQERRDRYGVMLSQSAYEIVEQTALEFAEFGDLDVSVSFNMNFNETLSWAKLSPTKQLQIYELLILGLVSKNKKLRLDAEHFLGCIALHPNTAPEIKGKLRSVGNNLIADILELT
jgi:hypothetical protein